MATRLLQLDDLRQVQTPDKIASLFQKLGYNARSSELDVRDLELPARSTEAVWKSYLIANQGNSELQVLLFHLHPQEFSSPSVASNRMRSIANSLCRRPSNFLLLGTKDYNQLMLVNPRKSFDEQMNLKVGIRKLLIDRVSPTNYDRDRLEAIAVHNRNPQELYQAQCEAFDVEKLTKQFFKGYKDLFDRVQQVIKEHNVHSYFENQERLHQFSQKLLGRIMFLYFLQKKEFLAGDRSFLTTQYRKLKLDSEDNDYYIDVLEPLFFDTLNKHRANMESPWGKIPYLNGGLFNRDYGIEIKDAAGLETPEKIEIPNSLFDPGDSKSVLNFFNSYNFTISENVEGDEDVAVDPEMLGKVFENMLEVEERGKSGTFYTPRGIVHFMCSEVLSRYLSDETGMDLETVKKIIEFDPEQPANYFKELISPQQARKLKLALQNLRCLDPAVGSAAFPMGMMQVILNAYQSIAQREGNPIKRGSLAMSRLKRNIIANNLYGVDIKPEAIEIAKLRMWLSLVVDIPDIDDVEPLPNLEYKLMCGDSLISTINGEVLIPDPVTNQDAIQLQLKITPIQQAIQPLLELQQQYFDAQADERSRLRKQILEAEANVFKVAIAERRNVWENEQSKLNKTISKKGKLTKNTEKKKVAIAAQISELDKLLTDVENKKRSLSFFQYYLHFRDVFEVKGGFDIVIGNPPYISALEFRATHGDDIRDELNRTYKSAKGTYDIYVLFVEKGMKLMREKGQLAYITPNKYLSAKYGSGIREYILENGQISRLVDLSSIQVFQEASVYPIISFIEKFKNNSFVQTTIPKNNEVNKFEIDSFVNHQLNSKYLKMLPENIWGFLLSNEIDLLEKLIADTVPLHKLGDINATSTAAEADQYTNLIRNNCDEKFLKIINTGTIDRYQSLWGIAKMTHCRNKFLTPYLSINNSIINKRRREMYSSPKIIFAKMGKFCEAFIDINGEYASVNTNCFYNQQSNISLEFIGAFCNSNVFTFLYKQFFEALKMSGGYYPFQAPQLRVIPCKKVNRKQQAPFINLVNQVIEIKTKNINADISLFENEINQLMYKLYSLSSKEIEIIENSI